jgi:hypothetical protein
VLFELESNEVDDVLVELGMVFKLSSPNAIGCSSEESMSKILFSRFWDVDATEGKGCSISATLLDSCELSNKSADGLSSLSLAVSVKRLYERRGCWDDELVLKIAEISSMLGSEILNLLVDFEFGELDGVDVLGSDGVSLFDELLVFR